MARNSVITAVITADTSAFDRAIGNAQGRTSTFGKNAGLAIAGIGAAVGGAVAIAAPLVNAASDWEEAASRVSTVFGEASTAVESFADQSATALGISRTDALSAAGNFGVLGTNAGLTGDALSTFSTDLVTAASDLASFNNLSTDEALQKLQSGLAGEAEPLRALGIDLSAAAVEAKAAELGLGGLTGELTEQEKVMARSAIILDQNNSYMGDFARTSDGLANQQRILSARFADTQAELGEKLLPIATAAAGIAIDLIDAFSGVIDVFSEDGLAGVLDLISEKFGAFDTIREVVGEVAGYIVEQVENIISIFDGLIDFVRAVFTGEWGKAWEAIKQIFSGIWDYMKAAVELWWKAIKFYIGVIIDGVKLLWDWSFLSDIVGGAIDGIVDFFTELPGRLGGLITTIFDKAAEIGGAIKDGIIDGFSSAAGFALDLVSGLWGAFKDLFNEQVVDRINNAIPNSLDIWPLPSINLPDNPIPRLLAKGGIVTGPTLAIIGEAGPEAVIPLSGRNAGRYGVGGGSQMIHVTLNVDGRVLAEVVRAADADWGYAS